MIDFIDISRTQFYNMTPEEAFPRSVSDVEKHKSSLNIYGKGCPIHVRGSLLHNHYIKEKGLEKKYSMINNGDKIKFVYLKKSKSNQRECHFFQQRVPT